MRLIDADALMTQINKCVNEKEETVYNFLNQAQEPSVEWWYVEDLINNAPTVDAVPKGVLEQYKWERDIAMEQLEEYGIPFGTNKDEDIVKVVRCKECKYRDTNYGIADNDECRWLPDERPNDDDFCSFGERREP